jgi:hypothetical protein
MNNYTTKILLSDVVHGTASGNYDGSSQLFYSDPVQAANYYGGQGNIQTITYRLQDFIGIITVQAALGDNADTAVWSDVDTHGDIVIPTTGTYPVTVIGNFVWLRARVEFFDSGTIQAVTVAY